MWNIQHKLREQEPALSLEGQEFLTSSGEIIRTDEFALNFKSNVSWNVIYWDGVETRIVMVLVGTMMRFLYSSLRGTLLLYPCDGACI